MKNLILIIILLIIIFSAAVYIYNSKKNGKGCIGCPHAKQCNDKRACSCNFKSNDK